MEIEDRAPVFSLTLHRLQRAPRAIHRAFLARATLFRHLRNIEGTYLARGLSFLRDELIADTCAVQMISRAEQTVLVVGAIHRSLLEPALRQLSREKPHVKIHHFASRNDERLLVVDGKTALLGAGRLQLCVEGEIAKALAVNYDITAVPLSRTIGSTWPFRARLDLESIEVGFSRTIPVTRKKAAIEIERLTLNAIKSARRFVYIETENLTATVIVSAIVRRLELSDGPEFVLILPPGQKSLLNTLQLEALSRLEEADLFDRFRCFERPESKLGWSGCKPCHVMIVDDQFLKIGTSVLTSRSLGAEHELDLSIEAVGRTNVVMSIARLRRELLGDLLDVESSEFDARFLLNGRLAESIESFFRTERRLNEVFGIRPGSFMRPLMRMMEPIIDPKRPRPFLHWIVRRVRYSSKTSIFALILLTIFALLIMIASGYLPSGT